VERGTRKEEAEGRDLAGFPNGQLRPFVILHEFPSRRPALWRSCNARALHDH
jgi:hypothetical protein